MREIWLPVVGFEGFYEVSNTGKVKRMPSESRPGIGNYGRPARMLKSRNNNKGYPMVDLWRNGERAQRLVHRLVAEAFIQNPHNYPEVNHKDENPANCRVENLEWCTRVYNMNYGNCGAKIAKANGKCVEQFQKDGSFVGQFASILEAQRQTGISQGSIGDCLHGRRKTAGGYVWNYGK